MDQSQPMPDRPSCRADSRRARVIETARTLFADQGFHATGIAQVAAGSGVAVGQIYRDFTSKEEIVAAIAKADCASFMAADALKAAIARGDGAAVRDWIRHFIDPDGKPDGRLFVETVAEAARNERIGTIFNAIQDDVRAHLLAALAAFAPQDAVADQREVLAELIIAIAIGLLHHHLLRSDSAGSRLAAAWIRIIDREIDALAGAAA